MNGVMILYKLVAKGMASGGHWLAGGVVVLGAEADLFEDDNVFLALDRKIDQRYGVEILHWPTRARRPVNWDDYHCLIF